LKGWNLYFFRRNRYFDKLKIRVAESEAIAAPFIPQIGIIIKLVRITKTP
jgi:hypothetical protein